MRDGIRPQQKRVTASLALPPPKNVTDLRRILGIVQYYRDTWEKRTDLLAPLPDLVADCGTSKTPWRWDAEHDAAFKKIKQNLSPGMSA
jgi:hypothetical protein